MLGTQVVKMLEALEKIFNILEYLLRTVRDYMQKQILLYEKEESREIGK